MQSNSKSTACQVAALVVGLLLDASAASANPTAAADENQHEIRRGETLYSIAAQQLVLPGDWTALQKLNQIRHPRRLQPGAHLRIPLAWLRQTPSQAEVVFVQGPCWVRRAGQATDEAAVAGTLVRGSDSVRTEPGASMTLRFADGSRLLVVPGTEFVVEQLALYGQAATPGTRLRLTAGKLETQVATRPGKTTRFEIQTPAVNLGVRGTEFRTHIDPADGSTRVEVLAGRVAGTAPAGSLTLDAGFGAVARPGMALTAPQPLLGAPNLSALPSLLDRVPLRLAWPALAGATAFRAQVFAAESGDRLLLDGVFTEPAARWIDLPDGRYTLRVRALDGQALEGLNASAAFTLKARPEPPFTRQPTPQAKVYGELAQFVWVRSSVATAYRLQVATQADFKAPVFDRADIVAAEAQLPLAPGLYHWRVASIAAGQDQGPFSDAQPFEQRAVPASPTPEPPALDDAGLVFRWKAPEAGQKVQFQVASDAAFAQIVLDQLTDGPQGLLPAPAPGPYFLRARTVDADGFKGNFGAAQQIDVPPPPTNWWLLLPVGLLLLML